MDLSIGLRLQVLDINPKVMTRLNIKDIVTADPIVCYSLTTPKLEVQDVVTMIEGQEPPVNNELTHEDADENALEPHHQFKTQPEQQRIDMMAQRPVWNGFTLDWHLLHRHGSGPYLPFLFWTSPVFHQQSYMYHRTPYLSF